MGPALEAIQHIPDHGGQVHSISLRKRKDKNSRPAMCHGARGPKAFISKEKTG
jgi:hypothetical protein